MQGLSGRPCCSNLVLDRMLRTVSRRWQRCFTFHSAPAPVLQVKVWLGETQAHYYILSRFLISRMLTVTKIPYMKVGAGQCTLRGCACVHVMCQCKIEESGCLRSPAPLLLLASSRHWYHCTRSGIS